jgi:hypothetical protein
MSAALTVGERPALMIKGTVSAGVLYEQTQHGVLLGLFGQATLHETSGAGVAVNWNLERQNVGTYLTGNRYTPWTGSVDGSGPGIKASFARNIVVSRAEGVVAGRATSETADGGQNGGLVVNWRLARH